MTFSFSQSNSRLEIPGGTLCVLSCFLPLTPDKAVCLRAGEAAVNADFPDLAVIGFSETAAEVSADHADAPFCQLVAADRGAEKRPFQQTPSQSHQNAISEGVS